MVVMSVSSTEVEEQLKIEDSTTESSKKAMISYTREFLLSLSELEVCKKLPEGFDSSILSEFDCSSDSFQDRRVPGTLSGSSYKRTDYGSPGPGRGDSGRGLNRWDSRSSGRSDTDTDSEPGRRYGSQPRRPWQSPEHDGLLGSGSFPRPSGYAAGAPVPRFRPNDNVHLNRTNEPYHPPRPYKAGPHSRRETNDSFNDETFGSADDASEDRVEEEKKRRAEFELMRKEQHKALQEKQMSTQVKTNDLFSDIGLLDKPFDDKTSSDLDSISNQAPKYESIKVSVSSQALPSRPLVPPGFVSSVVDKSSTTKSIVHSEPLEMGKVELEDSHQNTRDKAQENGFSTHHNHISDASEIKHDKMLDLPSILQGVDHAKGPRLLDVSEVLQSGEIIGLDFEVSGPKLLGEPARSTSVLDKLFGNASTADNGSKSNVVKDDPEPEDTLSSNTVQSKFARWFPEEERKPPGNASSENPFSLLSLIAGGEKGRSNVSDISSIGSIFTPEKFLGHKLSNSTSTTEIPEAKPAVMTCEDLEQSMLSEISGVGPNPNSQPAENEHRAFEVKTGHSANSVNNQASHHILSLLQKGSGSKDPQFDLVEERAIKKSFNQEVGELDAHDESVTSGGGFSCSTKSLTLESLFGTAFMKELHSTQRNGSNHLVSNDGIEDLDKAGDCLGFNNVIQQGELSKHEVGSKFSGSDGRIQVTLPEEDSLINLLNPINSENSMFISNSSSIPVDVLEKLSALGGAPRDERSMLTRHEPFLLKGPNDLPNPELPFQNLHPHASSPQLHPSQMNHNRPLFHPLDPHPTHIQFPPNMVHPSFPHPNVGLSGFDRPVPPLLQQMHMGGNLPPSHSGRGFPGVAPMPPHLSHNPANYILEPNPVQNFPFDQRQSYLGGPGIGPTGPELGVGDNPPEAFQRLMEMELRANPKQIHPHPFAANGPSRAMYGHELDTGFGYR